MVILSLYLSVCGYSDFKLLTTLQIFYKFDHNYYATLDQPKYTLQNILQSELTKWRTRRFVRGSDASDINTELCNYVENRNLKTIKCC
jgi:hypothetical protein